ncbi:exodeoxyribonuclease VII small subunit [Cecembia lonarensis]|uniref:Exodeoxyribonuclease VII small subunit n=1 Tax=Cecembia lonarensis (strain CCUG 58316 / KCTC 22772 / LW9) TaxID=1225176 RepID=K1M2Y7_CECL9|nr:exodeoxyribonuclease VII small subunit [Cecembia lonarensis]EKB50639.1 Exonuclease VII small subunit [Cecembia lonarensis LW9]
MENNTFSYDKAIHRIEEIVSLLESGEKGMDELSELVKEASQLVKKCKNKLRMTEEEIIQALKDTEE